MKCLTKARQLQISTADNVQTKEHCINLTSLVCKQTAGAVTYLIIPHPQTSQNLTNSAKPQKAHTESIQNWHTAFIHNIIKFLPP
jgi:hypothetical protein